MPDPRRTLAEALELFRGKRYAQCARTLEPLCAAGEPTGALSLAAMALSLAGEAEAASRCFERHLARQPADAAAWNNFGNHLRTHEPGRAIDCYGRAIALKPDFADARFNLALLHNERREHRAALTALAPGAHAPCTPREHALAASLHLRLSEWEAAAPHLEAQLAHDPAAVALGSAVVASQFPLAPFLDLAEVALRQVQLSWLGAAVMIACMAVALLAEPLRRVL